MSDNTRPKKGGKNLTTSPRRLEKYNWYRTHQLREKHKLFRVCESSGKPACEKYAKTKNLIGFAKDKGLID